MDGLLIAKNNATLRLGGNISNQSGSTILIDAQADNATVEISGNVLLNGGGTVRLQESGAGGRARIAMNGTLTNVDNSIEGEGLLGTEQTDFVNQSSGIIDANVPAGVLDVDPETNFINEGTLQASGGGILRLNGASTSNFANSGGTIQASGSGSRVELANNPLVTGGTLRTNGGGQIEVAGGHTGRIRDVTVDGLLVAQEAAILEMNGTITNQMGSLILVDADTGNARLNVQGNTTLVGGGTLMLSQTGGGGTAILGNSAILTNVDNTIQGAGNLGNEETDFINESAGIIRANVPGGILNIDPETNFINRGLLQDTADGILQLNGSGTSNFQNEGGTLRDGGRAAGERCGFQ